MICIGPENFSVSEIHSRVSRLDASADTYTVRPYSLLSLVLGSVLLVILVGVCGLCGFRRPWRSLARVLTEIVTQISEIAAEIGEVQIAEVRIGAVLAAGARARREEPRVDAVGVEGVEAGQHAHLLAWQWRGDD